MPGFMFIGSPARAAVVTSLLIGLSGQASSDTWNPIQGANDDFEGNQMYGAQLAVAEMRFLPSGSQQIALTLLVAITTGENVVKLYSFDTGNGALALEDDITVSVSGIQGPIAFTPTFTALNIDNGAEPCLVIPTLDDGATGGSISIVRLTMRDQHGDLVVLNNRFFYDLDGTPHWSIYHVAELPSGYAISTEFGEDPPPDIDENSIVLAVFNSYDDRFEAWRRIDLPYIYYGDRHVTAPCRAYMTACQSFQYGNEFDGMLCYTTTHNGGVLIWAPLGNAPIISQIAASQHGGWDYNEYAWGELGDVHRAAILEGGTGSFPDLDNIQIDNRLLFFSDNTMGFIVFDVSKPDEPQYVWQWDCDTRPREDDGTQEHDWAWHGAGDNVDDSINNQATAGSLPGETFGIGVASSTALLQSTIHLYVAGGVDGLRLFDLSEFLDPFGMGDDSESDFDDLYIYTYDNYAVGDDDMHAYDLRTFSENGNTYVFTSWRGSRANETGPVGLTVHFDEGVTCD